MRKLERKSGRNEQKIALQGSLIGGSSIGIIIGERFHRCVGPAAYHPTLAGGTDRRREQFSEAGNKIMLSSTFLVSHLFFFRIHESLSSIANVMPFAWVELFLGREAPFPIRIG